MNTAHCNCPSDLPDFGQNHVQLVVGTDPSQGIYGRNQKPFCFFSNALFADISEPTLLVARCSIQNSQPQQCTPEHNTLLHKQNIKSYMKKDRSQHSILMTLSHLCQRNKLLQEKDTSVKTFPQTIHLQKTQRHRYYQ